MKEIQDLAYTLKRSGFEKQANKIYSLVKTAGLSELKSAIKDTGGKDTQNQPIESLVGNFKEYAGTNATGLPSGSGAGADAAILGG